jgi:predicted DNA-binding protein (MmcQ/YjbR family)
MVIDQLRTVCKALPAVTEDIKWGHDLVFSVGGKMFCVADLEPPFRFSFKVPDENFECLSISEGFIPAPYMARAKWVKVTEPTRMNSRQVTEFLQESYRLVKAKLTKKQREELGI